MIQKAANTCPTSGSVTVFPLYSRFSSSAAFPFLSKQESQWLTNVRVLLSQIVSPSSSLLLTVRIYMIQVSLSCAEAGCRKDPHVSFGAKRQSKTSKLIRIFSVLTKESLYHDSHTRRLPLSSPLMMTFSFIMRLWIL